MQKARPKPQTRRRVKLPSFGVTLYPERIERQMRTKKLTLCSTLRERLILRKMAGAQQEALLRAYLEFHRAALECRILELDEDLVALEREKETQGSLPQIDDGTRAIKAELAALRQEASNPNGDYLRREAGSLWSLVASGEYEEITPATDGSLTARTSPITIAFDDWDFALGRYDTRIGPYGTVTIRSADGTGVNGFPHPHVASDGVPCLGNVGPGIRRAIGRMRIAEALSAIHDFISSYNPDSPYVWLTRFDPSHRAADDRCCEECPRCRSPYCIMECPRNETGALFGCVQCTDYRTEYCYATCPGNEGFAYVHPCDQCRDWGWAACADCCWSEYRTDCDDDGEYDDCDWVTDDELGDLAPVPLVENGGDLNEYMLSDCEEPGGPCQGCVRWSTPYCLRDCPHNDARLSEGEDSPEARVAHATGRQRAGTAHGSVQCCEDCVEDATYCFLQCPRNEDWSKRSPCSHCRLSDEDDCNGNCLFRARRQELRLRD